MASQNELKQKSSSDFSEDESIGQYVHDQADFLSNLKQFLLVQQIALRQNIESVRTKVDKIGTCRKLESENFHSAESESHPSRSNDPEVKPSTTTTSQKQKKDEIQICPVCGMEFEISDAKNSLEAHVAGHWCSSSETE